MERSLLLLLGDDKIMSTKEHLAVMIDRLEYYLTKEIEKNISGSVFIHV